MSSYLWDMHDPMFDDHLLSGGRHHQNFGHSFHPLELRSARPLRHQMYNPIVGYRRNWQLSDLSKTYGEMMGGPKDQTTQLSCTNDKDGFQVCVDVHQFAPKEISVKTVGNSVVIEGKHEERPDDHGFISRHFVRRYNLPVESHDIDSVVTTLSSDGVLTVKAPMKSKVLKGGEKEVQLQIQHTGPAHLSIKSTDQHEKKPINGSTTK